VRAAHHSRRDRPQLVTEARPSLSQDISYRERRYLIMMGIRLVCFVVAVVLFVNGGGWLTAIPAVGAIVIPYFAVIFANGGREPAGGRMRVHQPNLPQRHVPPQNQRPRPTAYPGAAETGTGQPGESDIPGTNGAPGRRS
jgi:hypothetical protein